MKIVAFYLPQFYENEYNNKWWGEGYTDWVAAKNAQPLFRGHNQPRIPLDNNYYDLSDRDASVWKWQTDLAKEYGIYGFCIYHYWFAGKKVLDKPVEILRDHPEIDIHYSFCWDSSSWKRNWYGHTREQEILIEQDYGDARMWEQHFNDLLPYFLDERYIKIENKPVFHIYKTADIPCIDEMKKCWDRLAKEHGFDGVYLISGDLGDRDNEHKGINAYYNYEPNHIFHQYYSSWDVQRSVIRAGIIKRINKYFGTSFFPDKRSAKKSYRLIEKGKESNNKKTFLGIFSDYDDTPRRQLKGTIYYQNKPKYFEHCLKKQIEKSKEMGNEFLFITAWNEWGEGAYLEPDERLGTTYLEIIQKVLRKSNG